MPLTTTSSPIPPLRWFHSYFSSNELNFPTEPIEMDLGNFFIWIFNNKLPTEFLLEILAHWVMGNSSEFLRCLKLMKLSKH
ncbi:hypothetical protein LguiA_005421 [Lonicera macranthoides]